MWLCCAVVEQILADHGIGEDHPVHGVVVKKLREVASTYFDTFRTNLWKFVDCAQVTVTPMWQKATDAVHQLREAGVIPNIMYLDCDWHYHRAKAIIDYAAYVGAASVGRRHLVAEWVGAWHCRRDKDRCFIAGGSWSSAPGLRKAVMEVAKERGLDVHVEQSTCARVRHGW